jgi:cell wall-associated NlpC family hydrolase
VLPPALRQSAPVPPRPSARARRLRAGLLVGASATLTVTLLPGSAAADPDAATPAEAAQLVAEASHDLEVVTEQFNEAREVLRAQRAEARRAAGAAAAAQAEVDALDGTVRELARSAYTGENATVSTLDLVLDSDSADELLTSLGTLEVIAEHTDEVLGEVSAAADEAQSARAEAETATTEAREAVEEIRDQQRDLEARIADFEEQYEALSAAGQTQVDQAHGGTAVAAPAAAAAPSGAAQSAVDTAMAQVGDSYVWAAAGPDAFDCSGLMQYAYAAAGVSLPHSSSMQSQMGAPVSRSELQPGDLVFFYSPVSHVGMYIGNGQMVHASTPSKPVHVASIDSMGSYTSARRVL